MKEKEQEKNLQANKIFLAKEKHMEELLKNRLRQKRFKNTQQRQTILNVFLEHQNEHLSAEDVYQILKSRHLNIGLATVYRSLELLANVNILQRLEFGDGCHRYEIGTLSESEHQHHHLICLKCGKVFEFSYDLLEILEKKVQEKSGFQIADHQVKFYGYCQDCQRQLTKK